jgi:hypothetical protein
MEWAALDPALPADPAGKGGWPVILGHDSGAAVAPESWGGHTRADEGGCVVLALALILRACSAQGKAGRYEIINFGSSAMMLDTATGDTWLFSSGAWFPIKPLTRFTAKPE